MDPSDYKVRCAAGVAQFKLFDDKRRRRQRRRRASNPQRNNQSQKTTPPEVPLKFKETYNTHMSQAHFSAF